MCYDSESPHQGILITQNPTMYFLFPDINFSWFQYFGWCSMQCSMSCLANPHTSVTSMINICLNAITDWQVARWFVQYLITLSCGQYIGKAKAQNISRMLDVRCRVQTYCLAFRIYAIISFWHHWACTSASHCRNHGRVYIFSPHYIWY